MKEQGQKKRYSRKMIEDQILLGKNVWKRIKIAKEGWKKRDRRTKRSNREGKQ
jgi:hypothetical protein